MPRPRTSIATLAALGLIAVASGASTLDAAVSEGVYSFQREADILHGRVVALKEVIETGDLAESRKAYAHSRAPYEQIEVLAGSFEDVDCNIDCRPAAYDHGDGSPDFVGFHKIEALLFRDENVAAAIPYAAQLVEEVEALQASLDAQGDTFTPGTSWDGMLGLASEVVAKKISGEEETYSDLSLLIFHENWLGIMSTYMPFHDMVNEKDERVGNEVLESLDEALRGVSNYRAVDGNGLGYGSWLPYSSLDNYELKDITDLGDRVVTALTDAKELLELPEEGGEDEEEEAAAPVEVPAGFEDGVSRGLRVFEEKARVMARAVKEMHESINSGDIVQARIAYEAARPEYEQIEVLALCFEDIDSDIDARPPGFELGESDPGFKGFHKIERALFRDNDMETAHVLAGELEESTAALQAELAVSECNVVEVFQGMIGLALEIGSKKISGEEETFSDLTALIFENNWRGIWSQYEPHSDKVREADPEAHGEVGGAYDNCKRVVASAKGDDRVKAFAGSSTASYRNIGRQYREDAVECTYRLATALVNAAEAIGIFADENNPYHRNSFVDYHHLGI